MKVIMLSCNTGEGHNSAARAVEQAMQTQGVQCQLTDVLACLSQSLSTFVCNWFVRIYKYGPKLFDAGYRAAEKSDAEHPDWDGAYDLFSLGAKKLKELLIQGQYDAVVCTHIFSAMMMTRVRKELGYQIPCYFVFTDYTCYPYIGHCEMDGYFVPAVDLLPEYIQGGVPKEKIYAYGIPVRQDFYTCGGQREARQALGLPEEGPLLLVMCGSMGCGPMEKMTRQMAENLPENAHMVTICGRNERLQERLQELESPNVQVVGFTDQVHIYMDAADLIVTKPGGLSSTEAANKHLPMAFINTVGGCESHNFNFFLTHGFAAGSSEPDEVLEQTVLLLSNPRLLTRMRRNLEDEFTVNGSGKIAAHIIEDVRRRQEAQE